MFFLFGALPIDTLKEIPSRGALENLPEKACMNAFIHLKLVVFHGSMSVFIGFQGLRLVFHGSRSVHVVF